MECIKHTFLERFNQNHSGGWARKVLMAGADMVQDKNTVAGCQQNRVAQVQQ